MLVQYRVPNRVMTTHAILHCTQCYWTSVMFTSPSHVISQEHNPFQLSCWLPENSCSTTQVGISIFFLHNKNIQQKTRICKEQYRNTSVTCPFYQFDMVGWLVGFYGIATFVGYLTANLFFMKIVLFQTIQFRISTLFRCKYSLIVKNISISSYSV